MEILKPAIAGTLESSDAQVSVEPSSGGLEVSIESAVANQYGRQVKATIMNTLEQLKVTTGKIKVIDKGALDGTIKARLQCALLRSASASEKNVSWKDL